MRFRWAKVPWIATCLIRVHADGWCRIVALTDGKATVLFGQGPRQLALVTGWRGIVLTDTVKAPQVGQVIPVVGVRDVVRHYRAWNWALHGREPHDRRGA